MRQALGRPVLVTRNKDPWGDYYLLRFAKYDREIHCPACLPGFALAEGVGFEPTEGEPSLVFKTSPLNRSGTPPSGAA